MSKTVQRSIAVAAVAAAALLPLQSMVLATSGAWSPIKNMAAAREQHTATFLSGGSLLVAGGLACSSHSCTVLASATLYNPKTARWKAAGAMTGARFGHTATLLSNGKVLVTGGCGSSVDGVHCATTLASAELYNPATGTFTITGSMTTARFGHTATLLSNGQVLVAGGYNSTNFSGLASAELYDPTTGTWTATGSMSIPRFGHTATLINPGGKVLAVGGCCDVKGNSVTSAELYDPSTGTWTATGSMSTPRYYQTATVLSNGQVFVAGGLNFCAYGCFTTNTAEIYDPSTGTWTATAGTMTTARYLHAAARLTSGKVLISGGRAVYAGASLNSAELYDPATGTFTNTGSMAAARASFTASLLRSGTVLATGGCSDVNCIVPLRSAEVYHP